MDGIEELCTLQRQKEGYKKALRKVCTERDKYVSAYVKELRVEAGLALFMEEIANAIDSWFPNDENPDVQRDLRGLAGELRNAAGAQLIAEVEDMLASRRADYAQGDE